jgi:hypothetical protein
MTKKVLMPQDDAVAKVEFWEELAPPKQESAMI